MQELTMNEIEQVNGGGAIGIIGWGILATATIITGGGALAVAGCVFGMFQSYE
ncbi:hypothetical protein L2729_15695 [Shewanella gelidimarina]|uniref:hypothetical protein n=1 Tax=Shewanella gelidimarina TaxID=56813 RepID=UPI00200EFCA6|nr:hypothetical protein [Shewanella gelidimarina]MCL1059415.1 hypothetical protein [Shewanella gelidimarina]